MGKILLKFLSCDIQYIDDWPLNLDFIVAFKPVRVFDLMNGECGLWRLMLFFKEVSIDSGAVFNALGHRHISKNRIKVIQYLIDSIY